MASGGQPLHYALTHLTQPLGEVGEVVLVVTGQVFQRLHFTTEQKQGRRLLLIHNLQVRDGRDVFGGQGLN